jgi:fumarate reductase flavoprotein subunit
MQASLGNSIKGEGDNEDVHFADTVKGSDWGCDQDVARMFVTTAPKAIRELAAWGVPWNRIGKGPREVIINGKKEIIVEKDEAHGLINARDFGGTKKWRTCYTSDATGHTMLYAVANEALKREVEIHDKKDLTKAIFAGADIIGINHRNLETFEMDMSLSSKLIPLIPNSKIIVAESGITDHEMVKELSSVGADAFLVGEHFMRQDDITQAVKNLKYGV